MTHAKTPAPISWPPSQYWDGVDGNWSSFDLRVGTPEQMVRVLPSTAASATWVVLTGGCEPPSQLCSDERGGLFNPNQSTSWNNSGLYSLALELNLGRNESGLYGTDILSLGLSNEIGGPTLDNQTIAGIETSHYWNGIIGLSNQPMNLSTFSSPRDSFLTSLKKQNLIPSLSWGYTAGAQYRSKGVLGSLTFGGSDVSRYIQSDVSFKLAPDAERDLVVGLQSISTTFANGSTSILLPSPILTFIDSTIPYIYLPTEACKAFETNLGLVWNSTLNFYLVDDALHQRLLTMNPKFIFKIGNDKTSSSTVDISLPYASFDLTATPPLLQSNSSYFPIRRAASDAQLTLGRAFLQEAYIITDYDQNNFTVAQAQSNDTAAPNLVPIPWNATAVVHHHHLDTGSIIGISVGAVVLALLTLLALAFVLWRRRSKKPFRLESAELPNHRREPKAFSIVSIKEMGHNSMHDTPQELHDKSQVELFDNSTPSGSGKSLNELPDKDERYVLGAKMYELPGKYAHLDAQGTPKELFDKDSPTGSGKTLIEMPASSGIGKKLHELLHRNSHASGPERTSKELLDKDSPTGSGSTLVELPALSKKSRRSKRSQSSIKGYSISAPIDQTTQSASPPAATVQCSSNPNSRTVFDPERRVTKTSSSNNNSSHKRRLAGKSSPRTSSHFSPEPVASNDRNARRSSRQRADLNKQLPQVPYHNLETAVPVQFIPYRYVNKFQSPQGTSRESPSPPSQKAPKSSFNHLLPHSNSSSDSPQVSPIRYEHSETVPERRDWALGEQRQGTPTYAACFDYDQYNDDDQAENDGKAGHAPLEWG